MVSKQSCSVFQKIIDETFTVLSQKDVHDLAFLCDKISAKERTHITSGRKLCEALQEHDVFNERKVNVLICWLDELRLLKASKILKEYRRTQLKEEETSPVGCFNHENQVLNCFCVSCDIRVCPECAVSKHIQCSNCDVINISNISEQVHERRQKLLEEIHTAKAKTIAVKTILKENEVIISNRHKVTRSKIQRESFALQENIEKTKRGLLEKVDGKELSDTDRMMKTYANIEELHEIEALTKVEKTGAESTLETVRDMHRNLTTINNIKSQLSQENDNLKTMTVDLLYSKIANNGKFCNMDECTLVGSVVLYKSQLLHIFDERKKHGNVLLVCVDCENTSSEHWRHLVKIDNLQDPVVMSNLSMYYGSVDHALFAVGREVFDVKPLLAIDDYDSVESVSPIAINEIPEGSWITNLTAHYPDNNPNNEFVISVSNDYLLREYDMSGTRLRVIDTNDFVANGDITSIAYCTGIFAIIRQGHKDVSLINVQGKAEQCRALRLPVSSIPGMMPIHIIWTGLVWLLLYVVDGVQNEWMVVYFSQSGEFVEVCDEGTSSNEIGIPVSITRWSHDGYITFADGNVRRFRYGD